ncbi:hypothetical protein OIC43_37130 [Streptomyces sp. NBC_00825]|uniref:hypothetical protein n=1 Tax=unclassified Streptomyces TaxID=2593676 RepID=UPI002ED27F9E|nr:hypothetical protein OG832_06560 [Streptomyces sp. NBC_00826]WTH94261.1 hypothetical protein OIC43_37130 [Streptomyces sp. NBC_00825]WTI02996.1 hypothetical protein OHA23_37110 [Streptomyces sp. NBC_00822]
MNAEKALSLLSSMAENSFDASEKARQELTKACAVKGFLELAHLMEAVMVADANAKPWQDLFRRVERHGAREGLAKMRENVTEDLVSYGVALSTSMVVNAERLAEQDGLRRFLSATNGMDIDEGLAPAEEAAPEGEAQPEPAPAPVEVPRATPAQKRTLEAIRDSGIKLQEFRVGRTSIEAERGARRPRKDMVLWVVEQRWAKVDTSTSLYTGQKVTLTELGEAILAS